MLYGSGPHIQLYDSPIMLYGSGEFPSGAEGERNVPLKYIKDRCKKYFDFHLVNEFHTLQICHHCKQQHLFDYVKVLPETTFRKIIRGMVRLPECKANRIKSRDEVGAINIMIWGHTDINPDNPFFDRQLVWWNNSLPKQKLFDRRRNMMVEK